MKVKSNYYKEGYDRHEACENMVKICNEIIKANGRPYPPESLMAKRIVSIIAKHYKLKANSDIRICKEWEDDPRKFINFVLDQHPNGKVRLVRLDNTRGFEPKNLVMTLRQ